MESVIDDRSKLLQKIQLICARPCPKYWFPQPGLDDCPTADKSYQVKDVTGQYFTIRPIFYEAMPYKGRATRVFAWIGLPSSSVTVTDSKSNAKVPAMVLVHGGGGTAFKNWVELWARKGVAAISIAVEGQTDEPLVPTEPPDKYYAAHSHAGPRRQGVYGDWKEPVEDQWIFQAVADTILANLLLVYGFSDVIDTTKVGLMGISWGGIVVCTVQGMILPSPVSFSHVIPAYGCGNLTVAKSPMGRALTGNLLYPILWDPCKYLPSALSTSLPSLWMSWPEDPTFPMNCFRSTYSMMKGPVMLSIIPKLGHGHQPIWNRPESYFFSKFVWNHLDKEGTERCWCHQLSCEVALPKFSVQFCSEMAFQGAKLAWSPDTDDTTAAQRKWNVSDAVTISTSNNGSNVVTTAEAIIPDTCQSWMIVMTSVNQGDGELVVTSTYQTRVKL